jgi:hypothetical protein
VETNAILHRASHDDLREVAEKFLRDYLATSGSRSENVQPAAPAKLTADHVEASRVIAAQFVRELGTARRLERQAQRQAELDSPVRIEIDASPSLVMLCRQKHPRWLACPKRSIWAHAKEYALTMSSEQAEELQAALQGRGFETTIVVVVPQKQAEF